MNKPKMIYLVLTSVTLAMSLIEWWFLILSAIGTIAYNALYRSGPKGRNTSFSHLQKSSGR